MITDLPANTVERLSLYRRKLLYYPNDDQAFIHSHRLASLLNINPAHVRRDLMLIGFGGDVHKGYNIKKLIEKVGEAIDSPQYQKIAFVGIGDMGRTVAEYFNTDHNKLEIAVTFRLREEPKVQFPDVHCYHISKMKDIIKKEKIELCVLAVPRLLAKDIAEEIVSYGVKGILNFTSIHIEVPDGVYVENFDMIAKLEKLSYLSNTMVEKHKKNLPK